MFREAFLNCHTREQLNDTADDNISISERTDEMCIEKK